MTGGRRSAFPPKRKENDFLDFLESKGLWTGDTVYFENFVHPNRWVSFYGQWYLLTKLLVERYRAEAAFCGTEVKRIQAAGLKFPESGQGPQARMGEDGDRRGPSEHGAGAGVRGGDRRGHPPLVPRLPDDAGRPRRREGPHERPALQRHAGPFLPRQGPRKPASATRPTRSRGCPSRRGSTRRNRSRLGSRARLGSTTTRLSGRAGTDWSSAATLSFVAGMALRYQGIYEKSEKVAG